MEPKGVKLDLSIDDPVVAGFFLDHLEAEFRSHESAHATTDFERQVAAWRAEPGGWWSDDGRLQHQFSALLGAEAGGAVLSHIEVNQSPEGGISSIEVDGNVEAATRLLLGVYNKVVNNKRTKFFHRAIFHYIGPAMRGEYWLKGRSIRLAPADPDDENRGMATAERVVFVDQMVMAIDDVHAREVGETTAAQLSAVLSLLLDVGLYSPVHEHRWCQHEDRSGGWTQERCQMGWTSSAPCPAQMPRKGETCPLAEYRGALGNLRYGNYAPSCPPETRDILRGLEAASPVTRAAVHGAARLYQTGLVAGKHYPTVALAYHVAAFDAIANKMNERGFKSYAKSLLPQDDRHASLVDRLWGEVRCAHFHAGSFISREYDSGAAGRRRLSGMADSRRYMLDRRFLRGLICLWTLEATRCASAASG